MAELVFGIIYFGYLGAICIGASIVIWENL